MINITFKKLQEFMACPLYYKKNEMESLVKSADDIMGDAVRTRLLYPIETFEKGYAVGGPINEKTGKTYTPTSQKFMDWAAAQGKPVLSNEQVADIVEMVAAASLHEEAQTLLENTKPHGIMRSEVCGVMCETEIDARHEANYLIDVTTTRDMLWWESDAEKFGYGLEAAFNQLVWAGAGSGKYPPMYYVVLEKNIPYRTGVWEVSKTTLARSRQVVEEALQELVACEKSGIWPTRFEEPRTLDF